jgi:hypothetical protein
MKSSTYLIRFRRLLLLGAVVAGIAVSAAAASYNGSPPDVRGAADSVAGRLLGPPDVRDVGAALHSTAVPDAFERFAAAHPYGAGLAGSSSSTLISPPDVRDAAQAARYGVTVGQSSGFHWGDWAIGIGSGVGLTLLLGGGLAGGLQRRQRMQTA